MRSTIVPKKVLSRFLLPPSTTRSHLAKRLKSEGHYIVACDWKRNEHMPEDVFCDEFVLVDLRLFENCAKVVEGCDHVFNLAADMGGMGFIQSNHSVIMYNNTMISFNVMEASRIAKVQRLFYASSACIYPEGKQLETEVEGGGLKEEDAWPAQPQDAYGLEKLASEELCIHYNKDFDIECRIAVRATSPYPVPDASYLPAAAFGVCHLLRMLIVADALTRSMIRNTAALPQHLRTLRNVEGRKGEGPGCLLPQGDHGHGRGGDVGRWQADQVVHIHRRLRGGNPAHHQVGLQDAPQPRFGRDGLDERHDVHHHEL